MRIKKSVLSALVMISMASSGYVLAKDNGGGNNIPDAVTDADFHDGGNPGAAKVELGKNLMYDKILSGNKNISCATCHHALTDTGDGLSLPIGEGGRGLGVTRDTGSNGDEVHERVPRNAPPVWNLGAIELHTMFHDGRVSVDASFPSGCKTPAGANLPGNLENVLACQAMFPVTSATEMAGQAGENAIADAPNVVAIWNLLAQRLQDPANGYVDMFIAAFDDISAAADITYAHAANAISAFERVNWRADNSPFDQYLRGDKDAMSENAQKGMELFYEGDGNGNSCASCHSGKFQTDMGFHAIAMPATGAGRGSGPGGIDDFGREQVTGDPNDTYRFRTPPLRNVALTAPYGHGGAFDTLEAIVNHHMDPVASLNAYDCDNTPVMPSRADLDALDCRAMDDAASVASIASHNELAGFDFDDEEVARIIDFLNALTDPSSVDIRSDVPKSVPSGLTLAE
jgi:cytochrome c peroxidase